MKEQNSVKIMKQMWESAELSRKQYYYMIGAVFTIILFYGLLLFIRFRMGFELLNSDFLSGIVLLVFLTWTFFASVSHKKKAEEIHNLYMEMVASVEK